MQIHKLTITGGGEGPNFHWEELALSPDYLHFTILCHLFALSPFNPYV